MDKAPDAYRTISEVGEDLDIAQHVLRFWETRFPQIKPLKRGGGRRYYRPDDVELLKGIRHLLYREGYTIKGVQRILREQGPRGVQAVGKLGNLAALGGSAPAVPQGEFAERDIATRIEPAVTPANLATPPAAPQISEQPAFVQQPATASPVMPASIEQAASWLARSGSAAAEAPGSARAPALGQEPHGLPPQQALPPDPLPTDSPRASVQGQMFPDVHAMAQSPAMPERAAPSNPGQVAMYRGGLQRTEAPVANAEANMPANIIQRPVSPTESIDRRARLRFALGELEACQSVIAEALRRGR